MRDGRRSAGLDAPFACEEARQVREKGRSSRRSHSDDEYRHHGSSGGENSGCAWESRREREFRASSAVSAHSEARPPLGPRSQSLHHLRDAERRYSDAHSGPRSHSLGRLAGRALIEDLRAQSSDIDSDSQSDSAPLRKRAATLVDSRIADIECGDSPWRRAAGKPSSSKTSAGTGKHGAPRFRLLVVLALCTILFGPVATMVSYLLLGHLRRRPFFSKPVLQPQGNGALANAPISSSSIGPTRVLHINLAHSERKARYVIDRHSDWESFVMGCQERLKIGGIARITDASGEGILSVADLMHEDNLIVHPVEEIDKAPAASRPPLATPAPAAHSGAAAAAVPTSSTSTASTTSTTGTSTASTTGTSTASSGGVASGGVPGGTAALKSVNNSTASRARSDPRSEDLCPPRHPSYRIAMLIPLLGAPPAYLPHFIFSAERSSALIDWFIFHESQIGGDKPAKNVKLVDLGKNGLAEMVGLKLGELLKLPARNATVLLRSMRVLFEKWPRLIAEYKPAFGALFDSYLSSYSHWGYCDLDMILGNLPFFIDHDELELQDVVTYSYGDAAAVYLRGQWTVHRNRADVNQVWQRCAHLGSDLEREIALKMAFLRGAETGSNGAKKSQTRFVSAEGCYSKHVLDAQLRVKIAPKQAVGLEVPSAHQALLVGGAIWHCAADAVLDQTLLDGLLTSSAKQRCRVDLPPVQLAEGAPQPLQIHSEGCSKWIGVEHRMCVRDAAALARLGTDVALFAKDGEFFAQALDSSELTLANGCRQAAFFHFQEWKKLWDTSENHLQVEPLRASESLATSLGFSISTRGISHIQRT